MEEHSVICPGCGAITKDCRQLYFELSYFTLSLHDRYFIHQLIVDAYAAQHAFETAKPIAITFALVGLYLVNERNYTGKQVQEAHLAIANSSKVWPIFTQPEEKTWLTVQDVLKAPESKEDIIKKWNQSVWKVWKSYSHIDFSQYSWYTLL